MYSVTVNAINGAGNGTKATTSHRTSESGVDLHGCLITLTSRGNSTPEKVYWPRQDPLQIFLSFNWFGGFFLDFLGLILMI